MSRQPFDPHVFSRSRFWLVWHRDEQQREYVAHSVKPIHVSRGGMVVYLVGRPPEKDRPVWVSLGDDVPDMSLFLPAEVLEIKPDARDEAEIRLGFFDLCPEDFYRAATRALVRDASITS